MPGGALTRVAVAIFAFAGAIVMMSSSASAQTISATEGATFSGQVVSGCKTTQPTVTINWGDSATSTGTLSSGGSVSGAHTYSEEGIYSGSVGGCASQEPFTADLADASLSGSGTSLSETAGQSFAGTVATFSDADPGSKQGYSTFPAAKVLAPDVLEGLDRQPRRDRGQKHARV